MNTMSGNTPERLQEALAATKQRLLADPQGPRILNLNAWNEWLEGWHLKPDPVNGLNYLEALHNVFGPAEPAKPAPQNPRAPRNGGDAMNRHKAKLLSIFGMLGLVIAGCVNVHRDASRQPPQPKAELWREFVVVAYSGPPLAEVNAARYREIAEAGIDVIVPGNGTFTGAQNLRAMDLAHAAGLRVIPMDRRIFSFGLEMERSVDDATLEAVVADYRNHPAFAGYAIKDEPGADLFPALRRRRERLVERDPDHEPLINLFPSYASPAQLGVSGFRTYVRDFLATVKPRLLSYDFYPLRENATEAEGWFSDLTLVREEARAAGISFWVFMQSQGIKDYLRVPNRAEILWQANTALAFGARGICWFSCWTPPPDQGVPRSEGEAPIFTEQHYGAMLDNNGARTSLYDHVRAANLFLRHAGRALLDWDNAFVAQFQRGQLLEGGAAPVVTVSGDDANVVVGTFQRQDQYRVLIANRSWEKPSRFRLETTSDGQVVRLLTATETNSEHILDESGLWRLEPGGAVLLEAVSEKPRQSSHPPASKPGS